MNTINCPLCKKKNIDEIEIIETDDLISIYKKAFNINIVREIPSTLKYLSILKCNSCFSQFYHPLLTGSELFYEEMQQFEWYYLSEKQEYLTAGKYINSEDNVLEVGCGSGFFANFIPSKNYVGLEFNDQAIEKAIAKRLNVIKESIQNFSKSHESKFDVVCCFQVLEHIKDPHSFILSCLSCLKKNGLFIVSVPSNDSFLSLGTNLLLNMPPHHVTKWSDDCLNNIASIFNISVIEIHHEKVEKIHLECYHSKNIEQKFRNFFGLPFKTLDMTLHAKLIRKITSYISQIIIFLNKGGDLPNQYGHSVTVIYQKT